MEMENGKQIDAHIFTTQRRELFYYGCGYTRPQMEMEKGHRNYHFSSPLCLITSQPTDSGIFYDENDKRNGNNVQVDQSLMDIDYGWTGEPLMKTITLVAGGFINGDTMRYKCYGHDFPALCVSILKSFKQCKFHLKRKELALLKQFHR